MLKRQFQAQELATLLEDFTQKKASGRVKIAPKNKNGSREKDYTLVFNNGEIVYGGSKIPPRDDFVKMVLQSINPDISPVAIKFATEKSTNPSSIREVLHNLVRIRVITWEQVETYVRKQTLSALEYMLPHSGTLECSDTAECDLCFGKDCHGLNWSNLIENLHQRQEKWDALTPTIPSADSIPCIVTQALPQIKESAVRQHLEKWVDGKRSITEIAQQLEKDPLTVARSYFNWVQMGLITFDTQTVVEYHNRPTVLSVDDSPVVQATMKRILSDRYNLLLASNAVDALNLLNQNEVSLLLLDLTMPDIDGLDMCRTLRSIPKFHELPIIMVTARDGFVNKMKGQIAGTNRYLTKPFDSEKLLSVVSEFVNSGNP
ncbi:response regulator [Crocosphaera chwakensis]|uniref:Response regulator n=1 Tax=Crocosphaera chwakensis CCY0110 TaxID=391612 RepID=A3IYC7_9CHRO|nr:response regulator [Crocosphaera chwakensis]EAZ88535.1 response regulator [Crocosphaera chwakensis CCY0110]